MKLSNSRNTIITSRKNSSFKDVKINTSNVAVNIFVDKLYSDVVTAIVRELSTNAIDANRAYGSSLSNFIVNAPTELDPTFYIEDNGIGMDENEVYDNYSSFFSSTKNMDNDNSGMFGLGSKSPLAYTDTMVIETTKNGVKRTFIEVWDRENLPKITKTSEIKCDTHAHGTKISFIVDRGDINKFRSAICHCSFAWPSFPEILNFDTKRIGALKEVNHDIMSSYIYSNLSTYSNLPVIPFSSTNHLVLEMGNVIYPVEDKRLCNDFYETLTLINWVGLNGIIHAEIGDVDITPSREHLQYTKKTKDFIQSYVICHNVGLLPKLSDKPLERLYQYSNMELYRVYHLDKYKSFMSEPVLKTYECFINTVTKDVEFFNNFIKSHKDIMWFLRSAYSKDAVSLNIETTFDIINVMKRYYLRADSFNFVDICKVNTKSSRTAINSINKYELDNKSVNARMLILVGDKNVYNELISSGAPFSLQKCTVISPTDKHGDNTHFYKSRYLWFLGSNNPEVMENDAIDSGLMYNCLVCNPKCKSKVSILIKDKDENIIQTPFINFVELTTALVNQNSYSILYGNKRDLMSLLKKKPSILSNDIYDKIKANASNALTNLLTKSKADNNVVMDNILEFSGLVDKFKWSKDSPFYSAFLKYKPVKDEENIQKCYVNLSSSDKNAIHIMVNIVQEPEIIGLNNKVKSIMNAKPLSSQLMSYGLYSTFVKSFDSCYPTEQEVYETLKYFNMFDRLELDLK